MKADLVKPLLHKKLVEQKQNLIPEIGQKPENTERVFQEKTKTFKPLLKNFIGGAALFVRKDSVSADQAMQVLIGGRHQ